MAQDLSAAGAEPTWTRKQEGCTVTAEEERLLKAYLGLEGQDFEAWYRERFADESADREYKMALAEARAFETGRARAFDEILTVW